MKVLKLMCILVLFISDTVFSEFLSDMLNPPLDFIEKTWNDMVKAIQKPVKLRRLGGIGKRKRTRTTPPPPIFEMPSTPTPISQSLPFVGIRFSSPVKAVSVEMPPEFKKITFPEDGFSGAVTHPPDEKVELPYIQEPVWRTMEEWNRMQKPHFVKIVREFAAADPAMENIAKISEEDKLGVLFFI